MTTQPTPHTLTAIYEAAKAQLITFDAVVATQRALYPRCIAHDAPTAFTLDGMALCIECVTEHHSYIIERLRGA